MERPGRAWPCGVAQYSLGVAGGTYDQAGHDSDAEVEGDGEVVRLAGQPSHSTHAADEEQRGGGQQFAQRPPHHGLPLLGVHVLELGTDQLPLERCGQSRDNTIEATGPLLRVVPCRSVRATRAECTFALGDARSPFSGTPTIVDNSATVCFESAAAKVEQAVLLHLKLSASSRSAGDSGTLEATLRRSARLGGRKNFPPI